MSMKGESGFAQTRECTLIRGMTNGILCSIFQIVALSDFRNPGPLHIVPSLRLSTVIVTIVRRIRVLERIPDFW